MMKELIALFLLLAVLALAGTASAATSQWVGTSGDWATSSNWIGAFPVSATGTTYAYRTDSTASVITVSATGTTVNLMLKTGFATAPTFVPTGATTSTVVVNAGSTLQTTKATWMYSTQAGSKSTLQIYGTYLGETATSSTVFALSSGTSVVSTDTVQVFNGGVLNVADFQAGDLGTLQIGTSGSGNGTLDIYNGGVANVRAYTMGGVTSSTAHIYLEAGGYMWINSNVTAQVATDVSGHKIQQGTFDTNGGFLSATDLTSANYGYSSTHANGDGTTGATWINVPEPATVALLGLGGLLLLKRKRR